MQFSLERKMSPVKGLVNIESIKAEEDYTKQRLKSRLSNTTLIQKLSTNPHWNLQFQWGLVFHSNVGLQK